ncbi:MAG: hypothetical protein R2707_03410 [Acidimicrobiales bacterium]
MTTGDRGLCVDTANNTDLFLTGARTIGVLAIFAPLSRRLYTQDAS